MNLTPVKRNAPRRFFIILTPPAASAGKNLTIGAPAVSACESSLAVAIPGQNGKSAAFAAAMMTGSNPGATPNTAPASFAARSCSTVRIVPAPTIASGTSRLIAAIAPAAALVRKVTSRTGRPPFTSGRPPFTSAFASGTACSSFSITITGIIPADLSVSIIFIFIRYCRLPFSWRYELELEN